MSGTPPLTSVSSLREILQWMRHNLRSKHKAIKTDPSLDALDARLLVQHVTGLSHEQLLLRQDDMHVTEAQKSTLRHMLSERLMGKPIAKIIGEKSFYGRDFITNEHTLDPRPDSENVVEASLRCITENPPHDKSPYNILDLGTGTGCLIITLIAELQENGMDAYGTAVDISSEALKIAQSNISKHVLDDQISLYQGSWLTPIAEMDNAPQFDLIISNPPYVREDERKDIEEIATRFDPDLALYGGVDGLAPYHHLFKNSQPFLKPNGLFVIEHGASQSASLKNMAQNYGWHIQEKITDFGDRDRGLILIKS